MDEKPVRQIITNLSIYRPDRNMAKAGYFGRETLKFHGDGYCLLNLFTVDELDYESSPIKLRAMGYFVISGKRGAYTYEVVKKFKTKEDAEEYSKKNGIDIVT